MKYSVVIPVYNAEKYILDTLTCLKEQTYKDIEIIVVNDGSKDNSESMILDFKKNNPNLNIKYQRNENAGPSNARNTGIKLATGDFICFLDSDDAYDIHLFEELDKIADKDTDIIYFGFTEIDENGKKISFAENGFKYFPLMSGPEMFKKKYLKETWLNNCNEVYRLDLIKKNNFSYIEGVYSGEDANFIYKCLSKAKVVKCLEKDYFIHNILSTSLFNSSFSEKNVTEFKAIENTLTYLKENKFDDLYDYINSLYYHTRVTVSKKILTSVKSYREFNKLVKKYIPIIKKPKVLYFNKKQKFETRLFNFSRLFFYWFFKLYYKRKK